MGRFEKLQAATLGGKVVASNPVKLQDVAAVPLFPENLRTMLMRKLRKDAHPSGEPCREAIFSQLLRPNRPWINSSPPLQRAQGPLQRMFTPNATETA